MQARSVIDGLEADVVTLALSGDIDAISARAGLLPANWQARLPRNSSPYTSTIVFVVRKGNPKQIRDWDDLAKTGEFLAKLFRNVPVLDAGARGSTVTFAERGMGDVLIAWENEAFLLTKEVGKTKFEIVVPSVSILAEPPVALVDRNVDKHATRAVAQAYLEFLYTEEAQAIAAKHHYRPGDAKVAAAHAADFPRLTLFTIDEVFGGWRRAQMAHFDDGGTFDLIYQPGR